MTCFVHARRGFYFSKKTPLLYLALPQGLLFSHKTSFLYLACPQGLFILLKKSIFVLNMSAVASQSPPELTQGFPRPRPGPGHASGGKSMVSRTRNHTLEHIRGSRQIPSNPADPVKSRLCGGSNCSSDPTFHTRRGLG